MYSAELNGSGVGKSIAELGIAACAPLQTGVFSVCLSMAINRHEAVEGIFDPHPYVVI